MPRAAVVRSSEPARTSKRGSTLQLLTKMRSCWQLTQRAGVADGRVAQSRESGRLYTYQSAVGPRGLHDTVQMAGHVVAAVAACSPLRTACCRRRPWNAISLGSGRISRTSNGIIISCVPHTDQRYLRTGTAVCSLLHSIRRINWPDGQDAAVLPSDSKRTRVF